jgi:hypothetical protein
VLTKEPGSPEYKISVATGAKVWDLFGNPVADGTMLDEKIVYVWAPKSAANLEALLGK